jgi:hypothetical protein
MASKRELIEPHKGDKRYVRRDDKGHFKKEVNVGRALAADRRAHAKKTVKSGQVIGVMCNGRSLNTTSRGCASRNQTRI